MCGRYTVFPEEEAVEILTLIAEVNGKYGEGTVTRGDVRPRNTATVLTMDGDDLAPRPAAWGYPRWDGKGTVINARSETALQKPMFSTPLLTRRCVIPSSGFYEWAPASVFQPQLSFLPGPHKPSSREPKIKLLFRQPGEPVLYMAGMISTFWDEDGTARDVFVILTTAASDSMSPFHDRMPVILARDECEKWIRDEAFMHAVLAREGATLEWRKAP